MLDFSLVSEIHLHLSLAPPHVQIAESDVILPFFNAEPIEFLNSTTRFKRQ